MGSLEIRRMKVGDSFKTSGRTLTEADIVLFAGLTGDYHPAHTDEEYARRVSPFRKRVAHGFLVLSICNGLLVRSGVIDFGVKEFLIGVNNVKFVKPVFPGDTIYVKFEVLEKRASRSHPDMEIVNLKGTCFNQNEEEVMTYEHVIMIERE